MKVCFDTFGCRLNRAEALETEAEYLAKGWVKTNKHSDADLIVVRGCSVTARAQKDCEKLIAHIRRKYPTKRVIVAGCLPGAQVRREVETKTANIPMGTTRAFLKIQDGCNSQCSFCIVPKFRGKSVSIPFEDCLDRAKRFVDAGYREIVVTGCNLMQYNDCGRRLPDLTAALASISPEIRVRLGSIEPGEIANDMVDVVATFDNICNFLHLSIQSGSTPVLSTMRRRYSAHDVDALVRQIETRLPSCGLGCDLITGFPGEREIDFVATQGLIGRHKFNRLHVFPYSERPGTTAESLPCVIPREVRKARAMQLSKEGDVKRESFAKSFVGKTVEIVVEDEKAVAGWTAEYLWCTASNPAMRAAKRRSRVKIAVRASSGHVLSGIVL